MTRRIVLAVVTVATLYFGIHPAIAGSAPQRSWKLFVNTHPAPLFHDAGGIATGRSGNLFVADSGDHRVVKLSPTGAVLHVWGTDSPGPLQLSGPWGVAVDGAGNIYLADRGVVKLSYTGRQLARWTGGYLSYPRGIAADGRGNIYVLAMHPVPFSAQFDRITITRVSAAGKRLGTFTYSYGQPLDDAALAAAIATTPDGNLLLSIKAERHCHDCDGTYYLLRTISPSGATLSEVPEDAGGGSVTTDAVGDIFLSTPSRLEKLTPAGTLVSTIASPGCGPAQFGADLSLATFGSSLYVADSQTAAFRPDSYPAPFGDGVIHVLHLDATPQTLWGVCPVPGVRTLFGQINDLAVLPGGRMYVADGITSQVDRIAANGAVVGAISATHPSTVAADRNGDVYVPNILANSLDKFSPNGRLLARTSGVTIEASAVARDGKVYALTPFGQVLVLPPVGHGNKPLRQWELNGYTTGSGGLDPVGIALDGAGNVWVSDIRHNNIQKYSPTGRLLLIWGRQGTGPGRFQNPTALTVDGRGHLWVVDTGNDRVQEFDLRGRFIASYGREGQGVGQFLSPEGIGVDARGDVFVGDRRNDRIQELAAA